MEKIRILIVDDHSLVCESLRTILELNDPQLEVVGTARNGEEAIRAVVELCPHVVLMDLRMPKMDGVEATTRLHSTHPDVKVIALTTFEEDHLLFGALEAGAHGYMLKDISVAELLSAVHAVIRGESPISPRVATKVIHRAKMAGQGGLSVATTEAVDGEAVSKQLSGNHSHIAPQEIVPAEDRGLTERERMVLSLIARGLSTTEIAQHLYISHGTVKSHLRRIYERLGLHTRSDLVIYAIRHGLSHDDVG